MTPFFQRSFSLMVMLCFFLNNSFATITSTTTPIKPIQLEKVDKASVEQMLGRKLTFQEKLVLPLIKKKIKKGKAASQAAVEAKTDGMAIAGFVCGLVGLLLIGFVLGILGIVFSNIALKRIKKEPEARKGQGLAIAGLILGIIATILGVIFIAAYITALAAA